MGLSQQLEKATCRFGNTINWQLIVHKPGPTNKTVPWCLALQRDRSRLHAALTPHEVTCEKKNHHVLVVVSELSAQHLTREAHSGSPFYVGWRLSRRDVGMHGSKSFTCSWHCDNALRRMYHVHILDVKTNEQSFPTTAGNCTTPTN